MTSTTNDARRHIADLVRDAKVAMLTTTTADGKQVSRPMALQETDADGNLWFFAYDDSDKVIQIQATPEANVSFSDLKNNAWTSLAGRAEIVHDRRKAEALYTPTMKAWFPDGLETPGLTLVKINASSAEYWDGPASAVGMAVGVVRAAVTKNPDNDPIDNETVEL